MIVCQNGTCQNGFPKLRILKNEKKHVTGPL